MATFLLIINANKEAILEYILYIYYSIQFWKNQIHNILALINLKSKINAMLPIYIKKLGFPIWKINISTQKIDKSILKIFKIAITNFQVKNMLKTLVFFRKTFLIANTSIKVVLKILFFIFSNINIGFTKEKLV